VPVITKIKAALGWLVGSILGLAIIITLIALPVFVVMWAAVALGVPWAITAQLTIAMWIGVVAETANQLLPAWAWFGLTALLWLAFLDVHVRWLVRDEFAKQVQALSERKD
jgi:hypothetical protein